MAVMVDHTNFNPQPKVDSAVVVLKPLVQKVDVGDTDNFDHVVKMCFSQRRKTLNNNLKSLVKDSEERKNFYKCWIYQKKYAQKSYQLINLLA